MKENIKIGVILTLISFFSFLNVTLAKSVKCIYGNTVSVIVGVNEDGSLMTMKNDSNPVNYKFNLLSSGAFIDNSGNYYCPEKIVYTLSYNPESRRNDYSFSFISNVNYPSTLILVDSVIDNSVNNGKIVEKTCAYGQTGKYIINYYTDGTIGPADNSYHISDDIPTTGNCLSSVYLCRGEIIYKSIPWSNNNCIKLNPFTDSFVQTGPSTNPTPQEPTTESHGPRLDYTSICSSNAGVRSAAKIVGYVLSIGKWIVAFIIIIFGIIDFSKAVISSDEKAISKAASKLLKRFIAGVVAVIIPILPIALLNLIKVSQGIEDSSNFAACTKCIFDPFNSCD